MTTGEPSPEEDKDRAGFEEIAARQRQVGPIGEFLYFLRRTRKWWLLLILVPLLVVGAVLVIGSTAAGPLIYTLF